MRETREKVEVGEMKRESLAAVHIHTSSFNEQIKSEKAITLVALVVTMMLHYDRVKKCSNSNSFLLSSI